MKNLIIIFILAAPLYASGRIEQPIEYIDLGEIEVQVENQFVILLPYIKPQGINRVPLYDIISIVFEKLIVDGKEVKKKRVFLSEKMFIDRLNIKEVSEEREEHFIAMEWFIERNKDEDKRVLRLVYESETGNTPRREEYIIPFGSREVFLTYSIRIPLDNPDWRIIDHFYTELQTVRWTIVWP